MSDDLEKQEPEKPKKKEKKEGKGGLSLPIIIIGSVGGLILIVVTVIFGYFVATKLFPQQPVIVNGSVATEQKSDSHSDAHHEEEENEDADHHHSAYMETGRITTNPKDAPATFVVLNLSIEFEPKDPKDPVFAEAIDAHGAIKLDAPIMKKLLGSIKNTINNSLASMTLTELNAKRPELTKMYKDTLKPVFKSYDLKLYEVGLLEFIVQ